MHPFENQMMSLMNMILHLQIKAEVNVPKTSVEKIIEKLPHLKDVNKPLDLAQLGTAKFFIIKSFSEENIFKVNV